MKGTTAFLMTAHSQCQCHLPAVHSCSAGGQMFLHVLTHHFLFSHEVESSLRCAALRPALNITDVHRQLAPDTAGPTWVKVGVNS